MNKHGLSRREFLRNAGLAGTGLILAACAPMVPSGAATESSAPGAERTSIALWGWWEERMQIFANAADAFSEIHPDIEMVVETYGTDLWPKVYASVPAGTGPALLKMQTTNFFQLRDQGLLIELPEDLFPRSFLESSYPDFAWGAYGRYCVPEGEQPAILTYNKQMFEEAGLDPDTPPRTWGEFLDAADKLTVRDANGVVQRTGVQFDNWLQTLNPLYQLGGSLVVRNGEMMQANYDSPEMAEAHRFLVDAAREEEVWVPDFPYYSDAIGNEQAAMSVGEAWVVGTWRSDFPNVFERLGFAPPPTPSGEAEPYFGRKNAVLNLALMQNRPAAETQAAIQFLEYLIKERLDTQLALGLIAGLVPAHAELLSLDEVQNDPFLSMAADLVANEYDAIDVPSALNTLTQDSLNMILLQNASIPDALAFGQDGLQRLIDEEDVKYLEATPPATN